MGMEGVVEAADLKRCVVREWFVCKKKRCQQLSGL